MKRLLLSSIFLLLTIGVYSQVTIGSSNAPDENALLDLKTEDDGSAKKGFLPPRMKLESLVSPLPITDVSLQEGMLVYNTNEQVGGKGVYYWKNNRWNPMSNSPWNIATTNNSASSNSANIYQSGQVGIGTDAPATQLHVKGTNGIDPLRIEGLSEGSFNDDGLLTLQEDGTVRKIESSEIVNALSNETSIPVPNVYSLSRDLSDFLINSGIGSSELVTDLIATKEAIPGMTFDAARSNIYFPTGVYQITFVYEADHNAPNCTLSSYFVDFPANVRVHSTASHNQGELSNHGGAIIFTAVIVSPTIWSVRIGRGQSGNCLGAGMRLKAKSTQISIFRIGDVS